MSSDLYSWRPLEEPPLWEEPEKPRRGYRLFLALISLLLVCILFLGLSGGALDFLRHWRERGALGSVVDRYMQAMMEQDVDAAYALFSELGRRRTSRLELQELTRQNYVLFDEYGKVRVKNIDLRSGFASGLIEYSNGFQGNFRVSFEYDGGRWKIHNIDIIVSPEKIRDFSAERA